MTFLRQRKIYRQWNGAKTLITLNSLKTVECDRGLEFPICWMLNTAVSTVCAAETDGLEGLAFMVVDLNRDS